MINCIDVSIGDIEQLSVNLATPTPTLRRSRGRANLNFDITSVHIASSLFASSRRHCKNITSRYDPN